MAIAKSILAKQRKLIERLQKENAPVYNWFVRQGVDFSNFQKSAATFVTAASLLFTTANNSAAAPEVQAPEPHIQIADKPEGKPKNDMERGQKVWAEYGQMIRESAAKYNVDPNLIFATIMIESGGNTRAIRQEPRIHDASYGLGQLLYGTARGLGYRGTPEGLYDPAVNIDLIGRYHRRNLDRYGHLTAQQLTTAYNTGSPYKTPLAGHLTKFNKWYNRVENLEVDVT